MLVGFRAVTAAIATGTALKTLLQLVGASNHRVAVRSIAISFDGVSTTGVPILVEVLRQSTAGTMSALTPVKANDSDAETLELTAQHTATAEPTAGDVVASMLVHPQSRHVFYFNPPQVIKGGGRLGVRVTAAVSVNAVVMAEGEE